MGRNVSKFTIKPFIEKDKIDTIEWLRIWRKKFNYILELVMGKIK